VLEALFAADGPVSAERLADDDLEVASVYRNLERLQRLGAVRHVHFGHGPGLYVLARGREREYLVCDRCGGVTALDPAKLDPFRDQLLHAFGHHARFSHFAIHGHCADCA
jgi:Fur family ferric uptake transcriptional regulator